MKLFNATLILAVVILLGGCSSNKIAKGYEDLQYVYKYQIDCETFYADEKDRKDVYRVVLKLPLVADSTFDMRASCNSCNYKKDIVFANYSRDEQVQILKELLSFRNDTDLAGTNVSLYGGAVGLCKSEPYTRQYTVQTDALYLFTILATGFYSQIYCPYPVLINKTTGEEINNNQEEILKVFDIYEDWFNKYSNVQFRKAPHPLYATNYAWFRCDDRHEDDIDSFKISVLNNGWGNEFTGKSRKGVTYYPDRKKKKNDDYNLKLWEKEMKKAKKGIIYPPYYK